METLLQDFRYSLRIIRRSPGFAIIAVLALALGIGANSAIFSIANAIVLKPLPYRDPENLVQLWMRFTGIGIPKDQNWVSPPEFQDLQQNSSLSHVAAIDENSFNIRIGSTPERVEAAAVSTSFFPMLGVQARLGRVFLSEEGERGRDHVVLLSDGLWRSRFGADPNIAGRTLTMNGENYEVVGVLPRGFQMPREAEVWTPLTFSKDDLSRNNRGNHGLLVIGRIKPGLTLEQSRADMQAVSQRIIEQNKDYPYARFNFAVVLVPLLEQEVGDVRLALWVLMGAVGLVLLIACSNVANLLLVRASAREREIAVRQALGIRRWRLVRQLLTESSVLALIGGLAGLLLGYIALRVLIALGESSFPRIVEAQMDWRVLAFTLLVSLLTGILFGLAPAMRAFRQVHYDSLKEGGRSTTGISSQRLRGTLVVLEMALSLMLLAGAGLLIRSFLRLQEVDSGFRSDGVLTMRISLPEQKYSKVEQTRLFYNQLLDRVRHLPGVDAAGAITGLPLSGSGSSGTATIETQAVPEKDRSPEVDLRPVTPGYFEALAIPLVRGRYFNEHDNETAQPVAIIDETLAATYWPNQDPIGQRIRTGGPESKTPLWRTVVGVVRHVRYRTLESPSRTEFYWPYSQLTFPVGSMSLVVHTSAEPHSLVMPVQREVQSIDPDQPVYRIRTMQEWVSESLARRRLSMSLLAIFAGIALLLAALGLYGVMSYSVAQRSHEMGIRMALGAQTGNVIRLVMGQGLLLSLVGVVAGLVSSLLLVNLMSSLLFNTRSVDPATFLAVAAALMAVAMLACFVPAWRAAKVDPVNVLRQE